MEENKDNELDIFVKKIVNETGLEQPSNDFTDAVLSNIKFAESKTTTAYQPPLSKRSWGIFILSVLGLLAYSMIENPGLKSSWFSDKALNWSIPTDFSWSMVQLSISNTYAYAFLGLAFFMGIQILILKHRFDARHNLS